jgi:cupin 2 domain-containing protein
MMGNVFSNLPQPSEKEAFENLFSKPGLTIQRIISHGQASPPGFWYEQAWDEWVILLSGHASLAFEGAEGVELAPGDYLLIPSGKRHRVASTAPGSPTVWLAVHLADSHTLSDDTPA